MQVLVLGNIDVPSDATAFEAAEYLQKDFPDVEFIHTNPNEDLAFDCSREVYLMDVVQGIKSACLLDELWIDKLIHTSRASVHDYDVGFQLKYLKKLGKLGKVTIIGIPYGKALDYSSIHSIFKKLVAQDIQGS